MKSKSFQTLIDLIFSNNPCHVNKTCNLITVLSDHSFTLFAHTVAEKRFSAQASSVVTIKGIAKRNGPQSELQQINWKDVLKSNDLSDRCKNFMDTFKDTMEKYTQSYKANPKKNEVCNKINVDSNEEERSGPKN